MTEVTPLRFRGINKMMHLKMTSLKLRPLYSGLIERFECNFRYIIFILISATIASDISWYCSQMNDTGQHWFGLLIGAARQHAINWANVDIDIFRHVASLGATMCSSYRWSMPYSSCLVKLCPTEFILGNMMNPRTYILIHTFSHFRHNATWP